MTADHDALRDALAHDIWSHTGDGEVAPCCDPYAACAACNKAIYLPAADAILATLPEHRDAVLDVVGMEQVGHEHFHPDGGKRNLHHRPASPINGWRSRPLYAALEEQPPERAATEEAMTSPTEDRMLDLMDALERSLKAAKEVRKARQLDGRTWDQMPEAHP